MKLPNNLQRLLPDEVNENPDVWMISNVITDTMNNVVTVFAVNFGKGKKQAHIKMEIDSELFEGYWQKQTGGIVTV